MDKTPLAMVRNQRKYLFFWKNTAFQIFSAIMNWLYWIRSSIAIFHPKHYAP